MTKTYVVLGDNNYWYSTFHAKNDNEALKELERIVKDIEDGFYNTADIPMDPESVYLCEARELKIHPITIKES